MSISFALKQASVSECIELNVSSKEELEGYINELSGLLAMLKARLHNLD